MTGIKVPFLGSRDGFPLGFIAGIGLSWPLCSCKFGVGVGSLRHPNFPSLSFLGKQSVIWMLPSSSVRSHSAYRLILCAGFKSPHGFFFFLSANRHGADPFFKPSACGRQGFVCRVSIDIDIINLFFFKCRALPAVLGLSSLYQMPHYAVFLLHSHWISSDKRLLKSRSILKPSIC